MAKKSPPSFDYEKLLLGEEVDAAHLDALIDAYNEHGSVELVARELAIPAELVEKLLSDPAVVKRAIERVRGPLTLEYIQKVIPGQMRVAAKGGAGSTQAAKLVAEVIGFKPTRGPGRPKKEPVEEPAPELSIEQQIAALAAKG